MKSGSRIIALLVVFLTACNSGDPAGPGVPVISVSILPQKYFIEQIAGDLVHVNVMIPPGASPATFEPSASQLARLSQSDLYMRIGYIGFEMSWMGKIQDMNPSMKLVDLSAGVDLIREEAEDHGQTNAGPVRPGEEDHGHTNAGPVRPGEEDHGHTNAGPVRPGEEDHGHTHGGVDPHIWMSVRNARIITDNIYRALLPILPDKEELLQDRYNRLINSLDSLDTVLEELLHGFEGRSFMIYHPALTYFARDYLLEQYPLELEGKTPSPAHMRRLSDMAQEKNIEVIFLQMQFDQDNAQALARETGAEIVQINPLDPDWYGQLMFIGRTFADKLK